LARLLAKRHRELALECELRKRQRMEYLRTYKDSDSYNRLCRNISNLDYSSSALATWRGAIFRNYDPF